MPRFQLGVTISAHGYVDVEAEDKQSARTKAQKELKGSWDLCGVDESIDTSLLDDEMEVEITSTVEIEDDDSDDMRGL